MTEFDWNFTSIHSSSQRIARRTGADLPTILLVVHPGHGLITQFRVMNMLLVACQDLLSLRLRTFRPLSLQHPHTRRLILQKEHCYSPPNKWQLELQLFVSVWFQVLFHGPSGLLFTFPSRYLFTIDHFRVFSLTGQSRQIRTRFLVSRPTQEYNHIL